MAFLRFCAGLFCVGRPGSQVPRLLHWESVDSNTMLLRKEFAWHIGGALPQHELEEWKLLYHSSFNGLSFNTFLGNISWVTCLSHNFAWWICILIVWAINTIMCIRGLFCSVGYYVASQKCCYTSIFLFIILHKSEIGNGSIEVMKARRC